MSENPDVLDRLIQDLANKAFAQTMAEWDAEQEAKRLAAEPTAEQQQATKLAAARFREQVTEEALLRDVTPRALRHVVREAASVFELRDDGALVAKGDATDPADPCAPLTPARWLAGLRVTDPSLFTEPGQKH